MDAESSSIATAPYCVIRTERDNIHSVCVGSPLSVLLDLQRVSSSSNAVEEDDDPEAAFLASVKKPSAPAPPTKPTLNSLSGFGNAGRLISTPIGSKGIFDSSSDDESVATAAEDRFDASTNQESLLEGTTPGINALRPISAVSGHPLAKPHIVLAGCANGTICAFESETGRLLDRAEAAHGMSSVLLVEELRADSTGIYFASQGRDGYVRFWSIRFEKGTTEFPTLPELVVRGERFVLRPHSSPVFVGGEAFCKAAFNKSDGLIATVAERGSIAIWDYETVLSLQAQGDTEFQPKCFIVYEGEKYGMVMSLQLLESSEKREAALVAGFEDGSVLVYSLLEVASTTSSGKPITSILYTLATSAKLFATTPILSFSLRKVSEVLLHQELSPTSEETDQTIEKIDTTVENGWIGVATSAEEAIVTFCFFWDFADSAESVPSGTVKVLETYKAPHQGYGDVKLRADSLVAIAGWDHRIRLFLFEASGDSLSSVTFQLRPLAILRHHNDSVHSISLGDVDTKLLASGSKDQRIALWRVY